MWRRGIIGGLAITLALAACGGGDGTDDDAAETTTTMAQQIAPSSTATSRPLTGGLQPNADYTIGDTVGPLTVSFRTGADKSYLDYDKSTFWVYRTPEITDLSVGDHAPTRVPDDAGTGTLSPPPADILAWLAARPFFEVTEPRRAMTAGEAKGEVVTVRTKDMAAPTNPAHCSPTAPVCADVFGTDGGGGFSTTPGEVTDFAVLEAGSTKVLVTAAHDAVGQELLQSLQISS